MEEVQEQQAEATSPDYDEDHPMNETANYDDGSLQIGDVDAAKQQTSTEQALPPLPSPVVEQKGPAQVFPGETLVIQR